MGKVPYIKESTIEKQIDDNTLTNRKIRSRTSTNFPVLNNNTRGCLETKQSNASSGFADSSDENVGISYQTSKLDAVLPPIASSKRERGQQTEIATKETKTVEISLDPPQKRYYTKEKNDSFLKTKPKPNALPPITSSDGVPDSLNIPLQKSMIMKHQEEEMKREPRKRAKTHTIYKEIKRGDSWELLKAEKIRCVELSKYEERFKAERNQKGIPKKVKKRRNTDKQMKISRPVGRKNQRCGRTSDQWEN